MGDSGKTKRWPSVQGEEFRGTFSPPFQGLVGPAKGKSVGSVRAPAPRLEERRTLGPEHLHRGETPSHPGGGGGWRETCLGRGVRETTNFPPPCGEGA